MPEQIISIALEIGQVIITVLFYYRVFGMERGFSRFLVALGTLLLAFRMLFWFRPEWYFLASQAETLASGGFALLEAVAVILLLRVLSKRPIAQIVLFFSLRVLIMAAASLLPFALFALFTGESVASLVAVQWNDLLFTFASAVLDIGLLIAAAEAVYHYLRKQTAELRWSQFVPVIAAQAVSLGLIALLREDTGAYALTLAVFAVLLVVYAIADAVLLSSFRAFVKNSELTRDVAQLLRQQELQKAYYLSVHAQLTGMQRMRHDYRNTLATVDALLLRGDVEKARGFISEYQSTLQPGNVVVYTGNEILDAVLNNKAEQARRAGIGFTLQLTLPNPLRIADTDLMSVFANLLDNAIEYVERLPEGMERSVEIHDAIRAGLWIIHFSNTFSGDTPPSFVTTKTDKELHGHGMGIVGSIAMRYDGMVTSKVVDGRLTVTVTLNTADIH